MSTRTADPIRTAFGLTPLGVATTTRYHLANGYTQAVLEGIDLLLAGPIDRFAAETLVQLEMRRAVIEARAAGLPFDWAVVAENARTVAEAAVLG